MNENEDDEYPAKGLIIGTKIVFGEPKDKSRWYHLFKKTVDN